jgi:hypothetical protein
MKLYHGTTERVARLALLEGLKPRALTGDAGHWKHTVDSNPDHVYLTSVYAVYFATCAWEKGDRLAILEVDTDLLDDGMMRPDEDFLEQVTRGRGPGPKRGGMKARTHWFRKRLDGFAHHWEDSARGLGTCSHRGTIPASAITRAAAFKPDPCIAQSALDPAICLINYQICRGKYVALTRWAIGDEVTVEEFLDWSAPMTDDETKAKVAAILADRSHWERLK